MDVQVWLYRVSRLSPQPELRAWALGRLRALWRS
jgi:hypothetical protein